MTIQQTGLSSLAGTDITRWLQTRAQDISKKSFGESLSEAYASSAARQAPGVSAAQASAKTAMSARQEIASQGRDLASAAPAPAGVAAPSPMSPFSSAAALAAATASTGTAITTPVSNPMAAATAAVSTIPAISTSDDSTTPTSTDQAPPANIDISQIGLPSYALDMLGDETVNPTVANLLTQNAPPAPYASVGQGSTDPAVFRTDGYMKALNLNSFLQAANHDNTYRFQQYDFELRQWSQGGMQGYPPNPPKYETVDQNAFNSWWTQYTANIGQNEPSPTSFVSNGPTDGGYDFNMS